MGVEPTWVSPADFKSAASAIPPLALSARFCNELVTTKVYQMKFVVSTQKSLIRTASAADQDNTYRAKKLLT